MRGEGPPIKLFGLENMDAFAKAIADNAPGDARILTKTVWLDPTAPAGFLTCLFLGGGVYLAVRLGGIPLTTLKWIILPIAIPLGIFVVYRMIKYRV